MSRKIHSDIVVIGAGMVGSAVASLLARCGFSVTLIERREPPLFDNSSEIGLRVSAISPGSAAILEQAGAWRNIARTRSCAYRRMHVEDRIGPEGLDFEAPAFGLERLGTIVENDLVQSSLWQAAGSNALVEVLCPQRLSWLESTNNGIHADLDSGIRIESSLLIGADGGYSKVRELMGTQQSIWEYNQKGLVCNVRKELANPGVAWQRFLPGGPLAFLPLADGRSSIVWTLPAMEADRLSAMSDEAFRAELQLASDGWLGDVTDTGPRGYFPLIMRLSERFVTGRVILLGDAAHVVHPLAGQGVNLGLADAAALVETLVSNRHKGLDLADPVALRKFERWRASESKMMAGGIHGLKGLFGPDSLGAVRRIGMKLVSNSWPLKEAFLRRAAGLGKNAPRLSRGEDLKSILSNA